MPRAGEEEAALLENAGCAGLLLAITEVHPQISVCSHPEASIFHLFQRRWSLRTQVSSGFLLLDFWPEHPILGTVDLEPKGVPL